MADNQAVDDTDGRVSPTIEPSLRSQQRQTERDNRANSRKSRGTSRNQVLRDAKRKLDKRKLDRSRPPSRGHSRSPMTIAPSRSTEARSRSPIPASRSTSAGTEAPREQSRSDTEAEVDDPSTEENEIPDETPRTPSTPRGRKKSSVVWNHCYLYVDRTGKDVGSLKVQHQKLCII